MTFPGSKTYRQRRDVVGGTSGCGSQGESAKWKAAVVNRFVREHGIESVIDFGCGDGNQLALAEYPCYLGVDVARRAIRLCRRRFRGDKTKRFLLDRQYAGERADLALSLDVIYHLIEDDVFDLYMRRLFRAAKRCVLIYSTNTERQKEGQPEHIRHRQFTDWIAHNFPVWQMTDHFGRDAQAKVEFFFYRRSPA